MITSAFEEEVNGTVIGAFTYPYEFWTLAKNEQDRKPKRFAHRSFENDTEAVAWVKATWPAQYAAGVEMRVFCGG